MERLRYATHSSGHWIALMVATPQAVTVICDEPLRLRNNALAVSAHG